MHRPYLLLWAVAVLAVGVGASKTHRPTSSAGAIASDTGLSFSFVPVADGAPLIGSNTTAGYLDLGTVSYATQSRRTVSVAAKNEALAVSTTFGIVIHDSSMVPRTSTILAALPASIRGATVRVDGVELSSLPRPIASHLRPEIPTPHRLEIRISGDVTEENSKILSNVLLTVIPE